MNNHLPRIKSILNWLKGLVMRKGAGEWINVEDSPPTENGHYWVVIMGDSEMDDCGGMIYAYGDYVILMKLTVEDDGPDNPFSIVGTAKHDEDWDLVAAWWSEKVSIPTWKG